MTTPSQYPTSCSQCKSGQKSYSGSPKKIEVRYACGSKWQSELIEVDGLDPVWLDGAQYACESDSEPICSNCDGVKCMHMVCRDWEAIDRCDGWCCPDCRPADKPLNWRKEDA